MKAYSLKLFAAMVVMVSLVAFSGCDDNENDNQVNETLNAGILEDFSEYVAQSSYNDLKGKAEDLYNDILALEANTNDTNLEACQESWRAARQSWEQTESFLFGPVATDDIDPRIDTWPVNFVDLEDQLGSENEFDEEYIDGLEDALKGFHPIEYLIFGQDGDKVADDLTDREIEYLKALALNLKVLTSDVAASWDPAAGDNYHAKFVTAGNGSTVYGTQRAAFEELVNAMAGICDEVGDGKMGEVLQNQNGEESPYSMNSLTDFTNNMKGVLNVYVAKNNGNSLEDLVKEHNLSLDSDIKAAINATITALDNLQEEGKTFKQVTEEKPVQVQNAIDAINALKDALEGQLLPFVQQHSN